MRAGNTREAILALILQELAGEPPRIAIGNEPYLLQAPPPDESVPLSGGCADFCAPPAASLAGVDWGCGSASVAVGSASPYTAILSLLPMPHRLRKPKFDGVGKGC